MKYSCTRKLRILDAQVPFFCFVHKSHLDTCTNSNLNLWTIQTLKNTYFWIKFKLVFGKDIVNSYTLTLTL